MNELLIPFGIHRDTGEIIEPEDAPKGRACDCLCPGCKAPLLSRHPKVKRYHFAHDSSHQDAKPEEECPFSSAVAVAMMVREVAAQLIGKTLETPSLEVCQEYPCCGDYESLVVSGGAKNTIDSAQSNVKVFGHHADLLLEVKGYPILVVLVYEGKPLAMVSNEQLQAGKAALLTLDCDSFSTSSLKRDHTLRFSEAVMNFVLQDGLKKWIFHPKTASLMHQAAEDHQCVQPEPIMYTQRPQNLHSFESAEQQKQVMFKREPVRYQCLNCDVEWMHDSSRMPLCPKCQRHLFARKIR